VLSSATIRYTHGIPGTALNDAVREERLGRNVAKLVRAPAANSKRTEPWTAAEAIAFLDYARGREQFAEVFELALRTGLRIGEVLALAWDDIDMKAGTIRVRHSVRRHLGIGAGLMLSEPKTAASRRRIPLPPGCTEPHSPARAAGAAQEGGG
jgi:integrase